MLLTAVARPSTLVPWEDAGNHVGDYVTVEGDVVDAHTTSETCVLEFAPDDRRAFRAILLLPLITSLPRYPDRLYRGRRVRTSGIIQSYKGRPEMILQSPGQIEIVDVAGAPPATAAAPETSAPPAPPPADSVARARPAEPPPARAATPPPASPPPPPPPPSERAAEPPPVASAPPVAAPAPAPPAASPPPPTTPPAPPKPSPVETAESPPRGLAEAVGRQLAVVDPCDRARSRWRDAASSADELAGALSRCLQAGNYRCRDAAAQLAPALSTLEWAEQQVADACP